MSQKAAECGDTFLQPLKDQRIVHLEPHLLALDQAGMLQDLEMLRYGRLGDLKVTDQSVHAQRPSLQKLEDSPPGLVG